MVPAHVPGQHGRGREFLDFVATNEAELKRAVRKNITYDPELFDDAFHTAIVKVYNAIEGGRKVSDIKQYIFISAKWEYINRANRNRREKGYKRPVSAAEGVTDGRGRTADSRPLLGAIRYRVGCRFGRAMRIVWERHRAGEHLTAIGREMMANPRHLAVIVHKIDRFVATDKEIQRIKKEFYDNADTE